MNTVVPHNCTVPFIKHTLQFRFDAGTSRGILKSKDVYYVMIREKDGNKLRGLGEIAPLKGLSIDDRPDLEEKIAGTCELVEDLLRSGYNPMKIMDKISRSFPAVRFGFEMALLDFMNGGERVYFKNDFAKGADHININGLIWMGEKEKMLDQIKDKLEKGYKCIKLKIGAINFEEECALLAFIRRKFGPEEVILRVDANGAFKPNEALDKLKRLADYQLHSIEQPIQPGQIEAMKMLCEESPLAIALDEELIGFENLQEKKNLLSAVKPQYIILKPTLLGGFSDTEEWIALADSLGIGWWITSALESNVGLNAIAQHTCEIKAKGYQGLGTGQLYHNNIASPLVLDSGKLFLDNTKTWDLKLFNQ